MKKADATEPKTQARTLRRTTTHGSKFGINSIDAHEQIISSTFTSGLKRLDAVNHRLKKFQSKCDNERQIQRNFQWIRKYSSFNEEIIFCIKNN